MKVARRLGRLQVIAASFANDSLDRRSRLEITYLRSIQAAFAPSFSIDSGSIREGFANGFPPQKSFDAARRRETAPRTVRESFTNEISLDVDESFGQSIQHGHSRRPGRAACR
jgi:hypothetical protein